MKALDLTNQRFGLLTALYQKGKTKKGGLLWHCQCECGKECDVEAYRLKNRHTQSCGCYRNKRLSEAITKHGDACRERKTELYSRWNAMKSRCLQPGNIGYRHYGGRGIKVCDEWMSSFETFKEWSNSHGYSHGAGLSLDRIDPNGDYCPENCRWVDRMTQMNNKRTNHRVLFRGSMKTLAEVSRETGLPFATIKSRVKRGWKDQQLAFAKGTRIDRNEKIAD